MCTNQIFLSDYFEKFNQTTLEEIMFKCNNHEIDSLEILKSKKNSFAKNCNCN